MNQEMRRIWDEMERAYRDFNAALGQFLSGDKNTRLQLITEGYNKNRHLALAVLERVPEQELKDCLPFLLSHARSVHGYLWHVRQVILRLPKDWLLQNIEAAAEPLLQSGTYDDYRRFLELYLSIDQNLTRRLAVRAAGSSDLDIRQAGEDFLEKLKGADVRRKP